jgi:hypothetical protein
MSDMKPSSTIDGSVSGNDGLDHISPPAGSMFTYHPVWDIPALDFSLLADQLADTDTTQDHSNFLAGSDQFSTNNAASLATESVSSSSVGVTRNDSSFAFVKPATNNNAFTNSSGLGSPSLTAVVPTSGGSPFMASTTSISMLSSSNQNYGGFRFLPNRTVSSSPVPNDHSSSQFQSSDGVAKMTPKALLPDLSEGSLNQCKFCESSLFSHSLSRSIIATHSFKCSVRTAAQLRQSSTNSPYKFNINISDGAKKFNHELNFKICSDKMIQAGIKSNQRNCFIFPVELIAIVHVLCLTPLAERGSLCWFEVDPKEPSFLGFEGGMKFSVEIYAVSPHIQAQILPDAPPGSITEIKRQVTSGLPLGISPAFGPVSMQPAPPPPAILGASSSKYSNGHMFDSNRITKLLPSEHFPLNSFENGIGRRASLMTIIPPPTKRRKSSSGSIKVGEEEQGLAPGI